MRSMSVSIGGFCTLAVVLICTHGQVHRDGSFQEMCTHFGGGSTYKEREGAKAMQGDTCTFKIRESTDTDESAIRVCEDNVPYHIIEAEKGVPYTTCKAEATLICKLGWVQFFGRCYKMTKELMTRDEAGEHCEKQGATVAFLHRYILALRVSEYFSNVYRFWIDASEAVTGDLIYDVKGGNTILAIDGYPYNLPSLSLARVALDHKAMVLCEYTPPMTHAESSYLLRRFSEIYYPTIETSQASYIRTASTLNRNINDPAADNKYCTRVLKPFIPDGQAQSAIPTREFMDKLKETNVGGIFRTSAFSANANDNDRTSRNCVRNSKPSLFHQFLSEKGQKYLPIDASNWRKNEPNEQCDAGTYSSGIVMIREGTPGLESMSDARYAPVYCQSVVQESKYGDCPDGFKEFFRKELGQKWCHIFISNPKKNYEQAQAHCETLSGAHLSGYASQDELDFLDKLMSDSNVVWDHRDENALIGAKRRAECSRLGKPGSALTKSYDDHGPCSRKLVFEWTNFAAPNPPEFDNDWGHDSEPNHGTGDEECLVLMKGERMYMHSSPEPVTKMINDHSCSTAFNFLCGREAPIVLA